jgi:hypothetical protein
MITIQKVTRNVQSVPRLTTRLNLTALQPTARAKGILDSLTLSVIPNSNYVIMVSLKYFCRFFLYCNHQVHRDFLITLYIPNSVQPAASWEVSCFSVCQLFPVFWVTWVFITIPWTWTSHPHMPFLQHSYNIILPSIFRSLTSPLSCCSYSYTKFFIFLVRATFPNNSGRAVGVGCSFTGDPGRYVKKGSE